MKAFEIEYKLGFAVVIAKTEEDAREMFNVNYPNYEVEEVIELKSEVFYNVES